MFEINTFLNKAKLLDILTLQNNQIICKYPLTIQKKQKDVQLVTYYILINNDYIMCFYNKK